MAAENSYRCGKGKMKPPENGVRVIYRLRTPRYNRMPGVKKLQRRPSLITLAYSTFGPSGVPNAERFGIGFSLLVICVTVCP